MQKKFSQRILLGLTGKNAKSVISKIKDVDKRKIKKVSLFFEMIKLEKDRKKIYSELIKSKIKEIPLIHIRAEVSKEEIQFFKNKYKTKYFTIHEADFSILKKWKGYCKDLYLEMDFDNFVSKKVKIEKIGGFCIDLSHFKAGEQMRSQEFLYTLSKKNKKVFECNHINGYSYKKNFDLHNVKRLSDFDYLKTLPKFVFGKVIAIETFNNIKEQIIFRNHLIKLLNKYKS